MGARRRVSPCWVSRGSVPTLFSSSLLTDKKHRFRYNLCANLCVFRYRLCDRFCVNFGITFCLGFGLVSVSIKCHFRTHFCCQFYCHFFIGWKKITYRLLTTNGLGESLRAKKRHLRSILPYLVLSFLTLPYLIQTKKNEMHRSLWDDMKR